MNFKKIYKKHKVTIATILTIVVSVGVLGGVAYMVINSDDNKLEEGLLEEEGKKADFIFAANSKGVIDLVNVKDKSIKETLSLPKGDYLYARDYNLDYIMAYGNNQFIKISEENGKLKQEPILAIKDLVKDIKINEFAFTNKNIVAKTDKGLINIKLENGKVDNFDIEGIEEFVATDKEVVYSTKTKVHSLNLDNAKTKEIVLEDKTEELYLVNNDVIAFNNFGSGNNKSTLLKINPSDLFIDKAAEHGSASLISFVPDSDDKTISFIDKDKSGKANLYNYGYKELKQEKNKIDISKVASNFENAVATKGYVYTMSKSNIEVFNMYNKEIELSLKTDKTFYMPILR